MTTPANTVDRPGRSWRRSVTATTTPGRLRRYAALLVVGCVLTALASVLLGSSRVDATGDGGDRLATLDFDAGELYTELNGANASAATGFGADRAPSPTMLARYDSYVTGAYLRLQHAQGLLAGDAADAAATESIGYQLPRYTAGVDAARSSRDQGLPQAAAELDSSAALMSSTILPAADALQQHRRAALAADYDGAGAFPLAVVLLGVLTLVALVGVSVREARRTKRRFSVGLVAAGAAMVVALVWWVVAAVIATAHVDDARGDNAAATDLSLARVVMLQVRAGETATVADGASPAGLDAQRRRSGDQFAQVLGQGGLLDQAAAAGADVTGIRAATGSWQAALEGSGAGSGIGSDPSRVAFVRLTSVMTDGAATAQGRRTTAIAAADAAFTGIAIGPALLALVAAAAVGVGLRGRLREYR